MMRVAATTLCRAGRPGVLGGRSSSLCIKTISASATRRAAWLSSVRAFAATPVGEYAHFNTVVGGRDVQPYRNRELKTIVADGATPYVAKVVEGPNGQPRADLGCGALAMWKASDDKRRLNLSIGDWVIVYPSYVVQNPATCYVTSEPSVGASARAESMMVDGVTATRARVRHSSSTTMLFVDLLATGSMATVSARALSDAGFVTEQFRAGTELDVYLTHRTGSGRISAVLQPLEQALKPLDLVPITGQHGVNGVARREVQALGGSEPNSKSVIVDAGYVNGLHLVVLEDEEMPVDGSEITVYPVHCDVKRSLVKCYLKPRTLKAWHELLPGTVIPEARLTGKSSSGVQYFDIGAAVGGVCFPQSDESTAEAQSLHTMRVSHTIANRNFIVLVPEGSSRAPLADLPADGVTAVEGTVVQAGDRSLIEVDVGKDSPVFVPPRLVCHGVDNDAHYVACSNVSVGSKVSVYIHFHESTGGRTCGGFAPCSEPRVPIDQFLLNASQRPAWMQGTVQHVVGNSWRVDVGLDREMLANPERGINPADLPQTVGAGVSVLPRLVPGGQQQSVRGSVGFSAPKAPSPP